MDQCFVDIYIYIIFVCYQMFHIDVSEAAYHTPEDDEQAIANIMNCMHYATHCHTDQRLNDSKKTPYINHPVNVAFSLVGEGRLPDFDIVRAALLHDVLEDTATGGADEIAYSFGTRVADIVQEVTDDKSLPEKERREQQIMKALKVTPKAKVIMLAEKLDNLRELEKEYPIGWREEHTDEYFNWTLKVVNGLRGTNKALEDELDEIFRKKKLMV